MTYSAAAVPLRAAAGEAATMVHLAQRQQLLLLEHGLGADGTLGARRSPDRPPLARDGCCGG